MRSERCAQTDYSAIAEIVLAEVRRIVAAQIRSALDIACAAEGALIVTVKQASAALSFVKLYVLRTSFQGNHRPGTLFHRIRSVTISPDPISLRQVSRVEHAWRDRLVGAARASWYDKRDGLTPIREGEVQIKLDIRSAGERVGCLDLEWRGIRPRRVNGHVRITRAALCDRHTRSGGFQRRRDSRGVSAAVVLQHDIHINAVVAIDDAVAVA